MSPEDLSVIKLKLLPDILFLVMYSWLLFVQTQITQILQLATDEDKALLNLHSDH